MHDGEYYYIKSHKNTFQLVGHHIQCLLTIRNTNDFDFMVQPCCTALHPHLHRFGKILILMALNDYDYKF